MNESSPTVNKNIPLNGMFLALFCLFVPAICFLFWSDRRTPPLASEHGAGIDLMVNYLLVSVGGLLAIGQVALAWFIWKYSREKKVTFRLASQRTEWKWALAPIILMAMVAEGGVLVIGVPVWNRVHHIGNSGNTPTVEVVAKQFSWTFRYPGKDGVFGRFDGKFIDDDNTIGLDPQDPAGKDDLVSGGLLVLPVNRPVNLKLRSIDVLHSFFLPCQRVRQDVVPGMVIDLSFVPNKTGEFEILCTELCGLGHSSMRGILRVVTAEEYEKWLKERGI